VDHVVVSGHVLVAGQARIDIPIPAQEPMTRPAVRVVAREALALSEGLMGVGGIRDLGDMAQVAHLLTLSHVLVAMLHRIDEIVAPLTPPDLDRAMEKRVVQHSGVAL